MKTQFLFLISMFCLSSSIFGRDTGEGSYGGVAPTVSSDSCTDTIKMDNVILHEKSVVSELAIPIILPDGRIFSVASTDAGAPERCNLKLFDPVTNEYNEIKNSITTDFCFGPELLPDGNVLLVSNHGAIMIFSPKEKKIIKATKDDYKKENGSSFLQTNQVRVGSQVVEYSPQLRFVERKGADLITGYRMPDHDVAVDLDMTCDGMECSKCSVKFQNPKGAKIAQVKINDCVPYSSPSFVGDNTIVFSTDRLHIFSSAGKKLKEIPVSSAPEFAVYDYNKNGYIYGGSKNDLVILNLDGSLKTSIDVGSKVKSKPIVKKDGSVVAATDDNKVLHFSPDGKLLAQFFPKRYIRALHELPSGDILIESDSKTNSLVVDFEHSPKESVDIVVQKDKKLCQPQTDQNIQNTTIQNRTMRK